MCYTIAEDLHIKSIIRIAKLIVESKYFILKSTLYCPSLYFRYWSMQQKKMTDEAYQIFLMIKKLFLSVLMAYILILQLTLGIILRDHVTHYIT